VCVCLLFLFTASNVSSSQSVELTFRSSRYVSMTSWMPRQFIASPKDSSTVSLFALVNIYFWLPERSQTYVHTGGRCWRLSVAIWVPTQQRRDAGRDTVTRSPLSPRDRSYRNACLSSVNCMSIAYIRLTQCSVMYSRGCAYWWLNTLNGRQARKQCLRRWVWRFVTFFYCLALNSFFTEA
jgi:hypothetical protein